MTETPTIWCHRCGADRPHRRQGGRVPSPNFDRRAVWSQWWRCLRCATWRLEPDTRPEAAR